MLYDFYIICKMFKNENPLTSQEVLLKGSDTDAVCGQIHYVQDYIQFNNVSCKWKMNKVFSLKGFIKTNSFTKQADLRILLYIIQSLI